MTVSHAIAERFQSDQLGELHTKDFRMPAEMVDQDLARLLILREITTLIEASRI